MGGLLCASQHVKRWAIMWTLVGFPYEQIRCSHIDWMKTQEALSIWAKFFAVQKRQTLFSGSVVANRRSQATAVLDLVAPSRACGIRLGVHAGVRDWPVKQVLGRCFDWSRARVFFFGLVVISYVDRPLQPSDLVDKRTKNQAPKYIGT